MKALVWGLFGCVLDGFQTYHLLKFGYKEVNPIIQLAITHFGDVPGIILVKAWFLMLSMVAVEATS